jgi:TonB family protein
MKLFLATLAAFLLGTNPVMTESIFAICQEAASQSSSASEQLSKAEQQQAELVKLFIAQEYDKGLVLAKQILETREKVLGPDHSLVALSLQNIAELLIAKKKQKEAADFYRRSLAIYEKATSGNEPILIESLGRYICVLTTLGKSDEIKDARKRLFKIENGFDEFMSASGQSSKVAAGTQGRALSLPRPDYSAEARANRISGSVVMKIRVDETGKVIEVKSLCGHPLLIRGSESAVWRARFEPAVINGRPVKFVSTIIYNFVHQ